MFFLASIFILLYIEILLVINEIWFYFPKRRKHSLYLELEKDKIRLACITNEERLNLTVKYEGHWRSWSEHSYFMNQNNVGLGTQNGNSVRGCRKQTPRCNLTHALRLNKIILWIFKNVYIWNLALETVHTIEANLITMIKFLYCWGYVWLEIEISGDGNNLKA